MINVILDPRLLPARPFLVNNVKSNLHFVVPHIFESWLKRRDQRNGSASLALGSIHTAADAGHIEIAQPVKILPADVPLDFDELQVQVIGTALARKENLADGEVVLATDDRLLFKVARSKGLTALSGDELNEVLKGELEVPHGAEPSSSTAKNASNELGPENKPAWEDRIDQTIAVF